MKTTIISPNKLAKICHYERTNDGFNIHYYFIILVCFTHSEYFGKARKTNPQVLKFTN